MASAVYSESQAHNNDRRPLSLCVDAPPSSSPFPSPSSSFLPPPMPGAHEFAVKPPPPGRNGRKTSVIQKEDDSSLKPGPPPNGTSQLVEAMTPTTPTPSAIQRQRMSNGSGSLPSLPSPTSAATPTTNTTPLPEPSHRGSALLMPKTPTTPSSPSFYVPSSPSLSNGITLDTSASSLTSNRPAPPSPAVSRRVSAAPSTSSARSKSSRSSRPPSAAVSRNNSTRKPHASASSPSTNRLSQLSMTQHHSPSSPHSPFSFVPPASHASPAPAAVSTTAKRTSYVKIRDFAFPGDDERHMGLGTDVPRANRVAKLNRALRGSRNRNSVSSIESSEDEETEEEDEGGWMGFKSGMERFSMSMGGAGLGGGYNVAGSNGIGEFPSQMDLARNFLGDEDDEDGDDEFFDPEGEGDEMDGEEEEPLYPGLYRALYAFEPEGTAEMALEEDQIVRVVGRGGGVGWAVVVDEREGMGDKHALVPESYLEVVQFDVEEEGDDAAQVVEA